MAIHMIITREGRRGYIFNTVLGPFDWSSEYNRCNDRADIPGIDADFVPKTTTNIWTNNPDL